jgi:hypothetical protein
MKGLYHMRRSGAVLWRAFSVAVFMTGIGLAGYACVQWLQTAHWQPLTVNGMFTSWPMTRNWIAHPQSWLGLHRVVTWALRVPMFIIVMVLGVAMLVLGPPLTREPTDQGFW